MPCCPCLCYCEQKNEKWEANEGAKGWSKGTKAEAEAKAQVPARAKGQGVQEFERVVQRTPKGQRRSRGRGGGKEEKKKVQCSLKASKGEQREAKGSQRPKGRKGAMGPTEPRKAQWCTRGAPKGGSEGRQRRGGAKGEGGEKRGGEPEDAASRPGQRRRTQTSQAFFRRSVTPERAHGPNATAAQALPQKGRREGPGGVSRFSCSSWVASRSGLVSPPASEAPAVHNQKTSL